MDENRALARRVGSLVAAALLLPICAVYLWFPGDADQALFELGAARMSEGAVYLRDLWDIKQPGIYWVYQPGGLLGAGVMGPRLLELALALLGAWIVWRLSGRWSFHLLARVFAPVLVVGTYLLYTHHGGVVVVEGLATPLLVAVFALVWPVPPGGGAPRPAWRWVAAGSLAGVVGVLKTFYLPLPALLVLGALLVSRTGLLGRVRLGALALAGVAVPLALTSAYFAVHGAWRLFWVTTTVIPFQTAGQAVMGSNRHHYLEMAIAQGALLLPLATAAVATARRRGTTVRELTLVATLIAALVLAWPQFPTPYRLLILQAPLGLLATIGADVVLTWTDARTAPTLETPADAALRRRSRQRRRQQQRARRRAYATLFGLLAALSLPSMRGPQRLLFAASEVPSWSLATTAQKAREEVLTHESASADVAPVRGRIRPGDSVYVIGRPQAYQLLHTREAIEISGWAAALQPARVWAERDRELARSRPRWVFVETDVSPLVTQLAPRFSTLLRSSYRPVATAGRGTWYRTDAPGVPAAVPGDNRLAEPDPS